MDSEDENDSYSEDDFNISVDDSFSSNISAINAKKRLAGPSENTNSLSLDKKVYCDRGEDCKSRANNLAEVSVENHEVSVVSAQEDAKETCQTGYKKDLYTGNNVSKEEPEQSHHYLPAGHKDTRIPTDQVCIKGDITHTKTSHAVSKEADTKYISRLIENSNQMKRKTFTANTSSKKRSSTTFSEKRMNDLSRPRTSPKLRRRSTLNCSIHRSKSSKKKAVGCKDTCESFLDRTEALEKQRQRKIERNKMEAQYNATVGKKQCPNCGGMQSFDEMIERRTKCPNEECREGKFEYCSPSIFVLKRFEKRMQRSSLRRQEKLLQIEEERVMLREQTRNRKSKKQKELLEKVSEKGNNDFLSRMAKDITTRKDKITRLEETIKQQVEKTCTFQPKINIPKRLVQTRTAGISSLAEPKHRKTVERSAQNNRPVRKPRKRAVNKRIISRQQQKKNTTKPKKKNKGATKTRNANNNDRMTTSFQRLLL